MNPSFDTDGGAAPISFCSEGDGLPQPLALRLQEDEMMLEVLV